jgi:pimeloyl-ACP methyl ester carboxylesterase
MHIAVAHPDRVAGLIAIGTLGANAPDGGMEELNGNLVARLMPDERAALDPLLAREAEGDDDPTLMAQILMTLWPSYSHVHGNVLPPVTLRLERPLGDDRDTMPSVAAHFQTGTLERGLPNVDLPALFLHGEGDPLPTSGSIGSAALIKGARVQLVEETGHFPWIERPGVIRAAVEAFVHEGR